MRLSRASAIVSAAVAVVVAIALPVGQLQLPTVVTTCCCPDPSNCHCPPEKHTPSRVPTMKSCHHTAEELASPGAPSGILAAIEDVRPAARPIVAAALPLVAPHASPDPNRPAAPS